MNADPQKALDQNTEDLDADWYVLEYAAWRSIRYHARREGFFSSAYKSAVFISMLSSSAAASTLAGMLSEYPKLPLIFSTIAALVSLLNFTINPSQLARTHLELKQKFSSLLQQMCRDDRTCIDSLHSRQCQRLEIEANEPTVYRALDLLCHNEFARSKGLDDFEDLGWFQRLTANIFHWPDIQTMAQKAAQMKARNGIRENG